MTCTWKSNWLKSDHMLILTTAGNYSIQYIYRYILFVFHSLLYITIIFVGQINYLFHCTFQAVATYDMRFLDVFAGWPGRSHDSRVFRHNPLYQTLPDRLRKNPEGRLIESYHILGDSAFPVSPQVITPFKCLPNQDLNAVQKKFNRHLSSKRNVRTLSLVMFLYSFNTCDIVWNHVFTLTEIITYNSPFTLHTTITCS